MGSKVTFIQVETEVSVPLWKQDLTHGVALTTCAHSYLPIAHSLQIGALPAVITYVQLYRQCVNKVHQIR